MKRYHIQVEETITTIICEEEFLNTAIEEILFQRKNLKEYILRDPLFLISLEPYTTPIADIPEIIEQMFSASRLAGVGPMAGVAGAIAYFVAKKVKEVGAEYIIVDNGGDIAFFSNKPIIVGVYAGTHSPFDNIGLKFEPKKEISGVCTSSATVGPSISFGNSDAVIVISDNVILADALATALGNEIKRKDRKEILAVMKEKDILGIRGLMVIIDDLMCALGDLPKIIKTKVDYNLITKG
ncbi:MAG: UPF0280 family protein [Candidatus Heimdallarchaeota archaeon]|nr:UPF0280 family protein [Candidatus Heimdallarchaeota archaeon]